MAIAPDFGERYLDTVYQTNWLPDLYGKDVLQSASATGATACSHRQSGRGSEARVASPMTLTSRYADLSPDRGCPPTTRAAGAATR